MVGDLLYWFPRIFTFVMLRCIISINAMFAPLVCVIRNRNIETSATMQYWLFIAIILHRTKYNWLRCYVHKGIHSCTLLRHNAFRCIMQLTSPSWWRNQIEALSALLVVCVDFFNLCLINTDMWKRQKRDGTGRDIPQPLGMHRGAVPRWSHGESTRQALCISTCHGSNIGICFVDRWMRRTGTKSGDVV